MTRASLDHIERGTCDGCNKQFPGWALYEPVEGDPWADALCGACIMAHEAVEEEPPVLAPWETEAGKYLKAQRNIRLDGSLWAIMPGSPLTPACQAEWISYRAVLHRMTVDCDDPGVWVWPEPPTNAYD